MTNSHPPGMRRTMKGVTLIEVLVSIIVLSIGLLGLAGLQAATTKYKLNSWARSSVSILFSDMADRIRANPTVAGSAYPNSSAENLYNLSVDWDDQQASDSPPGLTKDCTGTSITCTEQELATFDIESWRIRARTLLPQGAAQILGNRRDGFTMTLMWMDKDFVSTDGILSITPTCTGNETGLAQQTCCPDAADAPAGVRCARFVLVP